MSIITVTGRKPKVSLSDGHGMDTPGKRSPILPKGVKSETGNFMHENEFNRRVEALLKAELIRCGFEVLSLAPGDEDVPLEVRAKKSDAWGADFHLDIHANAFDGDFDKDASGIETLHYNSTKSKACAEVLHKYIKQGSKMVDRGTKDGSHLYMLRKPKAVANLVELGFMDDKDDIKLLLSESYRKECAIELAKGICEIFGKKYVLPKPPVEKKYVILKAGDTLWELAQTHKTTVEALEKLNLGIKATKLQPGQKIRIK